MKKLILILLGFAPLLGVAGYSIDTYKVGGGGGSGSSGGSYNVSGTIGQHEAGTLSGTKFSVAGGFWAVVQEPGAPLLKLTLSANTFVLSWSTNATGFKLEANPDVSVPGGWANPAQGTATNNGIISVSIPSAPGNRFFRLHKQTQ